MSPVAIAALILLLVAVAAVFLIANLLVGKLLRPSNPVPDKGEIYECGEPTIGTSRVQFDLRFYVVALLFLVFDVEVAFFFPWANVFGTATQMSDPQLAATVETATGETVLNPTVGRLYETLGAEPPPAAEAATAMVETGQLLAGIALVDLLIFFAVLLVGFAYLWYRGDLNWIRPAQAGRTKGPTNWPSGRREASAGDESPVATPRWRELHETAVSTAP